MFFLKLGTHSDIQILISQLFKLVNAHSTLDVLSQSLVEDFHLTPRPNPIGNDILATVALHVSLIMPLLAINY